MTFERLKFWKRKPQEKPTALLRYGMNLATWKNSPALVNEAQRLYATKWFQAFYSVLVAEIPKGYSNVSDVQLGRINGFRECISLIESMGEHPPKPQQEIESTFGVEKDEEGWTDSSDQLT